MLVRLLEAEEYRVRLTVGRQASIELESSGAHGAVLLIWSAAAPGASYMRDWARAADPFLLVEISTAPGALQIERKAPVVDFASWRGERGGRAWNALSERLRAVSRVLEPPPPQTKQAALASLGVAGAAAFGVVGILGATSAPMLPDPLQAPTYDMAADDELLLDAPMGGPLSAMEPLSIEDLDTVEPLPLHRFTPMEQTPALDLYLAGDVAPNDIRDPTLLERLAAFNPLRDGDN